MNNRLVLYSMRLFENCYVIWYEGGAPDWFEPTNAPRGICGWVRDYEENASFVNRDQLRVIEGWVKKQNEKHAPNPTTYCTPEQRALLNSMLKEGKLVEIDDSYGSNYDHIYKVPVLASLYQAALDSKSPQEVKPPEVGPVEVIE